MQKEPNQAHPPLSNPFDGMPIGSPAELAAILEAMQAQPEWENTTFDHGHNLLRAQIGSFARSVGAVGVNQSFEGSPTPEDGPINAESTGGHNAELTAETQPNQQFAIFEFPDGHRGESDKRTERLVEQGQGAMADNRWGTLDTFARRFLDWRPRSIQEAGCAVDSLFVRLQRVQNKRMSMTESAIYKAIGWQREAFEDRENLDVLADKPSESFISAIDAVPLIRGSEAAMDSMAHMRADARQFEFETGRWKIKGKGEYKKLVNASRVELDMLDDENLLYMWRTALQAATARETFWDSQLEIAQRNPRVAEFIRERLLLSLQR